MLLKWLNEYRRKARQAKIDRLTRQLADREPKDWRVIDDEVIHWPKAGAMWADETRILKELAECGPLARNAVAAIAESAEQSLWGHWLKASGEKKPGRSMIHHADLVGCSGHTKVHLEALLRALEALHAIGADEPAVVPLLREVIEECRPPSEATLGMMKRAAQQALSIGAIRQIPDDVLYRWSLRGIALNALGKAADIMVTQERPFVDCSESVADALHDPKLVVRLAAFGALVALAPSLPKERRSWAAPRVLSVLRTPDFARALRQNGLDAARLSARWEAYRQPE